MFTGGFNEFYEINHKHSCNHKLSTCTDSSTKEEMLLSPRVYSSSSSGSYQSNIQTFPRQNSNWYVLKIEAHISFYSKTFSATKLPQSR